jgi:hypothetical protein
VIDIGQLMAAVRANQAQSQRTFPPVVGRAPPQQPLPGGTPTMGNHMMPPGVYGGQGQGLLGGNPMNSGPYGQQAQLLAGQLGGLLGGTPTIPQRPVGAFSPGMFMPGFRPGINTPHPGGGGRNPYQIRPV